MKVPQIFDRNMKRLAFLDNAVSVGYSLEINSLWTATFTLPADDDKNAYCQPLNFVEIFDGDERIDLFRIIGEDLERSNGATRFYDCEHVLATLLSIRRGRHQDRRRAELRACAADNAQLGFGRLRFQAVFRVQLGKFNAACGAVRRAGML